MYYINVRGVRTLNDRVLNMVVVTLSHFSTCFSTSMTKLTPSQHDDLIAQYVELCVDCMDTNDLVKFVEQTLTDDFEKLNEHELFDEIRLSFDKEKLDELVDNVTTVTYGLAEGETLSFPVHDPTK